MRKYGFDKLTFAIEIVIIVLFSFVMILLFQKTNLDKQSIFISAIGSIVFFVCNIPFLVSMSKQEIRLDDSAIIFRSFHIEGKSGVDARVEYKDILAVELKKTFNFKVYALKLEINKYKKPVYVYSGIKNHKELYFEICNRTKNANPDALIDEKLIKYLSRNINDGSHLDEK